MPNIRQQSWTPSTIYQSCHKQQQCRHTIFRQLNTQQFETTQQDVSRDTEIPIGYTTSPVPDVNEILAQIANEESILIADTLASNNLPEPKLNETSYNRSSMEKSTTYEINRQTPPEIKGCLQKIKRNQSILTSMGIGT